VETETIDVHNNHALHRYEAHLDGRLAKIDYEESGDRLILLHTEVPEALGGRGIASRLARYALDDARAHSRVVVPVCPFVSAYIQRHPEYLPLVDPEDRRRLGQASNS
jgi:predicted GNAT family acetyltransferase